jgi:hypothetical protein
MGNKPCTKYLVTPHGTSIPFSYMNVPLQTLALREKKYLDTPAALEPVGGGM